MIFKQASIIHRNGTATSSWCSQCNACICVQCKADTSLFWQVTVLRVCAQAHTRTLMLLHRADSWNRDTQAFCARLRSSCDIVNESVSMILNQTLHDVYLKGAGQTHSRITSFLGHNLLGGRNVGCPAQNSHTRQANCRPAHYGSASISCRFGNQLDQVRASPNNTPVINKCTAAR